MSVRFLLNLTVAPFDFFWGNVLGISREDSDQTKKCRNLAGRIRFLTKKMALNMKKMIG